MSAGRAESLEVKPGNGLPSCKINNIVTEPTQDGRYDTHASIVIGARAISQITETHGLDITTYDFVADIYRAMTQVESNCYYVDFKGSRKTRLCTHHPANYTDGRLLTYAGNVAGSVLVAFSFKKSTDVPRTLFIATVQSSVTGEVGGTYKCSDGLKSRITEAFKASSYQQRFSNYLGGWKDDVGLRVNCVEHECMVPKDGKWKSCADKFD
ncbi:hypothetical protein BKA63DRAFT_521633 [Paraphoma chrysanthemicola]|nr:hypothetical protein BKA63DRAFT_521633 [Paraphoma chrysanthemicola]